MTNRYNAQPVAIPAKETLYKTAYSPMYASYVALSSARTDEFGVWMFIGTLLTGREILFRSCELERFCL